MPANVETAVYANTPAWHNEGTVLDTDGKQGLTVAQALQESGLDWEVAKVPVYADYKGKMVEVDGRYGVQRVTDGKVFGTVGGTWEPTQNADGFQVITDFMQGGTAWIEAAGALDGGKKIWILAHMAEDITIADETIKQYVLFFNGHDGRTSVGAANTDIRVVCQNTLTWATETAQRIVRVRHTSKASERLQEAKTILGMRDLRAEELAKQGEWLVNAKFNDKAFDAFLADLMPIKDDAEGTPAETMITGRRDEVRQLYKGAENLNNIRGTKWGALNAVVEYADFGRTFRDDNTQLKAQFGFTGGTIKEDALALLLA